MRHKVGCYILRGHFFIYLILLFVLMNAGASQIHAGHTDSFQVRMTSGCVKQDVHCDSFTPDGYNRAIIKEKALYELRKQKCTALHADRSIRSCQAANEGDSLACVALYESTVGSSWYNNTNWLSEYHPLYTWYGIYSAMDRDRVWDLELPDNNLVGTIPADIKALTECSTLDLSSNQLEGSIPDEIEKLVDLVSLLLNDNQLTGSIPPGIGDLPRLWGLYLHRNELSGSIPNKLGQLTSLHNLWLFRNKLEGSIPPDLGKLENLRQLYINLNGLSGEIPSKLGDLSNLEHMLLNGNDLVGSIPPHLGDLPSLTHLWLQSNQLQYDIPPALGQLKNLIELRLYNNNLSGTIPEDLGQLSNLERMLLDFNQLDGPIPKELGQLTKLRELDLSVNELDDAIPAELGSLANLEELHLYENELVDPIPVELGNLSKLKSLSLSQNKFKGPANSAELQDLQAALQKLTELRRFVADGNEFGFFPDLSSLGQLDTLEIQNNHLHFDSIEPNMTITHFKYAPQDSVGKAQTISNVCGTSVTLQLKFDTPHTHVGGTHNTYQWFHEDKEIVGATSDSYTIDATENEDTGHYFLEISNTAVPGLVLVSRPITLMVPEQVTLRYGNGTEAECLTRKLTITADVGYEGEISVIFIHSNPEPVELPEGIVQVAGCYLTIIPDNYLEFENARLRIPLNELTDLGIDPDEIKWLTRPEPGTGDWTDLGGSTEGDYFVSQPFNSFGEFTFGTVGETHVCQDPCLPESHELYQNYPNPFNPTTTIRYKTVKHGFINLRVFDLQGRQVKVLVDQYQSAGNHSISMDGSDLPNGEYFYKLETEGYTQIKKMVLIK